MITYEEFCKQLQAEQKHCYTCGNSLGNIRWECPICKELQCSEECRTKHIEEMDSI